MDIFNLVATLGLDTSGFSSGINGAEALINSAVPGLGSAISGFGNLAAKALTTAGSAAIDFGKSVFDTGLNFEKQIASVYAVTDATEDYRQEALKTAVINEAMKSSFTTAEVAAAAYYEGLAGYSDSEIVEGLHGIVVAAEASGESLQTTSDIITDAVRAFGDTAAEQTHYADVFAATATNTNTTIGKMGQAMKYVAPIAGALGYKVEDVAISLGVMADSGIKGSQAGTSLRSILQRLATDTGATSTSFGALGTMTDKLGVDFYDAEGKARPWLEFVKDAREAWKGFTEEQKQSAAEAFGELASSTETSTESLQGFVSELTTLNSNLNSGKISTTDYYSSIDSLSTEFGILGINVKKTNGIYLDAESILDQVTTKLNGLSDAQQVSYSKQIAGQRGMSGWLAIMNAADEKFDTTTEAINNCAGAAERMRDIRIGSNLYGDIEQLNSRIDALKTLIFGEIEGPARELAQFAISALDSINKAIEEGGLQAGIDELAVQLEKAAEKLSPIFESIGSAITPLLTSMLTKVTPQLLETALALGNSLASGVISGLSNVLENTDNPMLKWLGESLQTSVDIYKYGKEHPLSDNLSWQGVEYELPADNLDAVQNAFEQATEKGVNSGLENATKSDNIPSVELTTDAVVDSNQIMSAIKEAYLQGSETIRIDNFEVDLSTAQEAAEDFSDNIKGFLSEKVGEGFTDGSTSGVNSLVSTVTSNMPTVQELINSAISGGGDSGAISMKTSVITNMVTGANNVLSTLTTAISNAGNSGGSTAATNVHTHFFRRSSDLTNTVATSLGNAGSSAGNSIINGIQNKLNFWTFTISVIGNLLGLNGGTRNYASAMHNGRILHGATVFGMDGQGNTLVGGEAGPEAIIGTDELSRLITKAVGAGGGDTYATINVYQQPGENAEELAERVQRVLARQQRQRRTVYA